VSAAGLRCTAVPLSPGVGGDATWMRVGLRCARPRVLRVSLASHRALAIVRPVKLPARPRAPPRQAVRRRGRGRGRGSASHRVQRRTGGGRAHQAAGAGPHQMPGRPRARGPAAQPGSAAQQPGSHPSRLNAGRPGARGWGACAGSPSRLPRAPPGPPAGDDARGGVPGATGIGRSSCCQRERGFGDDAGHVGQGLCKKLVES